MKKISLFSAIFIVVCFLTCISCGYLLSTMLLSTNIFASTVTTENHTIYAISTAKNQNKQELENLKSQLQAQNGAGEIFEKENCFYLLASAYENLPDAEKVKNNLKNQNVESEILTIEISSAKIDGNFNNEEKSILQEAVKSKFETFKALYDVDISLDTNVFDIKKAKLECNNIFSKITQTKTNLETFFKNSTPEISDLKNNIQNYYDLLNKLVTENFESQNQTFSSLIKQTYLKILLN